MARSIKEAFEAALKLAVSKSGPMDRDPAANEQVPPPPPAVENGTKRFAGIATPAEKRTARDEARRQVQVSYGHVTTNHVRVRQREPFAASTTGLNADSVTPKVPIAGRGGPLTTTPSAPTAHPPWRVHVQESARFALLRSTSSELRLISVLDEAGRSTQIHGQRVDDEREVVMGIDFGTSCVKVVIGDDAIGKSFAVPFRKTGGVDAFLLPSVLFQTGNVYSLHSGTQVRSDLKLSLLANPEDPQLQRCVAALLTFVIRHSRDWLFSDHAAVYKQTKIVWKLSLGLPAAQHLQAGWAELFQRLARAAWALAASPADVNVTLVDEAIQLAAMGQCDNHDVEVTVVPEIAAQIYGFVMSNSFDRQAANIFLMADVGAGTTDSALFQVRPGAVVAGTFGFIHASSSPMGSAICIAIV